MEDGKKIAQARKQLILVGVTCVFSTVFILWLLNLRNILNYNRAHANDTLAPLKNNRPLDYTWEQFKNQLDNLKK